MITTGCFKRLVCWLHFELNSYLSFQNTAPLQPSPFLLSSVTHKYFPCPALKSKLVLFTWVAVPFGLLTTLLNNHVTPHVTHNWSKVRTPNDVMSGITRGKLRFWVGLSDDLQDIALHTDREERQLKAKPVELASYETIGDDSDHLRAQKRQFFGAKLLYKPLPSIILCCRLFVNFLTTNTLVQYRRFQTLHIRRSVARKYSFVCGYMKDHKIVFPPSLPSCLKVTRRKSKIASA